MSPAPTVSETQHAPQSQPRNSGNAPQLGALVGLFKKLDGCKQPRMQRIYLEKFMKTYRERTGSDLYPLLRLLLPHKDRERQVYGLKEQNLAKAYGKVLGLDPKRNPDMARLMNWTAPVDGEKGTGNFTQVLYEVVKQRSSVIESDLDLKQLNEVLDRLAQAHGGKNSEAQGKVLRYIFSEATAEEQIWIARIILKDLNISVTKSAVLSAFHPDTRDLFNLCTDLKKVTHDLWDPEKRLGSENKGIQLFYPAPALPMLCKRTTKTLGETVKLMMGEKFIIDEKLDGERMQLHKRGNEYRYYSRNGNDLTRLYGADAENGSLTPYIHTAFDSRVDDIVLDGEMLAWDPSTKRTLAFGSVKGAAKGKSVGHYAPHPIFVAFDLLHLNGQTLFDKTLAFRRKNLKHCVKQIAGRIQYVPESEGSGVADVRAKIEEIVERGGEGLVVKHPRSTYRLNERTAGWIKVKPEYIDGMGETMDLIVVGGTFGSGSRAGGVSTLVCAAFENRIQGSESRYITFASCGTGLTLADLAWIRERPWKTWNSRNPPAFLRTANGGNAGDRCDVYLKPQESFIVEIKAAQIIESKAYGMGCTLRFPRIKAIRHDLSISSCTLVKEILDSRSRNGKRSRPQGDIERPRKKVKTITTMTKPAMGPTYQGHDLARVAISTQLFAGLTFVVTSDPKSKSGEQYKKALTIQIRANGGTLKQIAKAQPGVRLFVVYGGTTTPYDLQLVIKKGQFDVLKPEWVKASIARARLAPFYKRYFFHATKMRTSVFSLGSSNAISTIIISS